MPVYRTPKLGFSYSQAIAQAYASAPEETVILDTLELRHPGFIQDGVNIALRVVNDHDSLTACLEAAAPMNGGEYVLFSPVRFGFKRPAENDSGATQEVEISIGNVSRVLVPYLDMAKESREPIEVTYRPFVSTDLTGPHMNPPLTLLIRSISVDSLAVTARAGFGDLVNRRFPRVDYTAKRFPGLNAR